MIVWTLDPSIYGMPDYGLSAGQSRTFTAYLGDKGRTRYTGYNPTGPIPVQLVYRWRGSVLAQFRKAWERRSELAYGANWMRITIPVELGRGQRGQYQYDAHFLRPFSTSLVGHDWWSVNMSLEIDASTPIGGVPATSPAVPTPEMWTLTL